MSTLVSWYLRNCQSLDKAFKPTNTNVKEPGHKFDEQDHLQVFKCDHCFKLYKHKNDLDKHLNDEHLMSQKKTMPLPPKQTLVLLQPFPVLSAVPLTPIDNPIEDVNHSLPTDNVLENSLKCPEDNQGKNTLQKQLNESQHQKTIIPILPKQSFILLSPNPLPVLNTVPLIPISYIPTVDKNPFKCNECLNTYETEAELEVHKTFHKPVFKCKECHKFFNEESVLDKHMALHVSSHKLNFQCKECHKLFNKGTDVDTHIILDPSSNKPLLKCKECYKMFEEESAFEKHIHTLHPYYHLSDVIHKCYLCPYETKRPKIWERHLKIQHLIEKPFKCNACEDCFSTNDEFLKHKSEVHSKDNRNKTYAELRGRKSNNNSITMKSFECKDCHKPFIFQPALDEHRKSVHFDMEVTKKPFPCNRCGQRFETSVELTQHKSSHPKAPKKSFECEECHKVFAARIVLQKHWDALHSLNRKLYSCPYCSFQSRQESLKRHISTHMTGPVRCDYEDCHKIFKSLISMRVHKRMVHLYKEWVCEWPECHKKFKVKKSLDIHRRDHLGQKDFRCEFENCGKSFSSRDRLQSHESQSHKKPIECSWPGCEERFAFQSCLESHINRVHNNIRPFKCKVEGCGKAYFSSSHLRKHSLVFHKSK